MIEGKLEAEVLDDTTIDRCKAVQSSLPSSDMLPAVNVQPEKHNMTEEIVVTKTAELVDETAIGDAHAGQSP